MISNELLSEVLGLTSGNAFVKEVEIRNSDIEFLCNKGGWTLLNIYELAHKCKEWALSKDYILDSQIRGYCRGKGICFVYRDDWTSEYPEYCLESFEAETEIEAIFKACEWILNNKPL